MTPDDSTAELVRLQIENARLRALIDCACNALTDSILCSGNDAETNLHFVKKLRRDSGVGAP